MIIFHSNFHFLDLILSNSFCCKLSLCAIQFGADCTRHRVYKLHLCLGFVLLLAFRGAVVSELICRHWERKRMNTDFVGAFAKLQKATISFVMSVRLPARMELGSH